MDARLSNLESEELLLMYLSGELDADSARQFEVRLERDPDLRSHMESMSEIDAELRQWSISEQNQPVARLDSSLRNALSLMRQHALVSPLAGSGQYSRPRAARWIGRAAVAAIVVAGIFVVINRRESRELVVEPLNPGKTPLVRMAIRPTTTPEYTGIYDMFDAPLIERDDAQLLVQDVDTINEMAQMLK